MKKQNKTEEKLKKLPDKLFGIPREEFEKKLDSPGIKEFVKRARFEFENSEDFKEGFQQGQEEQKEKDIKEFLEFLENLNDKYLSGIPAYNSKEFKMKMKKIEQLQEKK